MAAELLACLVSGQMAGAEIRGRADLAMKRLLMQRPRLVAGAKIRGRAELAMKRQLMQRARLANNASGSCWHPKRLVPWACATIFAIQGHGLFAWLPTSWHAKYPKWSMQTSEAELTMKRRLTQRPRLAYNASSRCLSS